MPNFGGDPGDDAEFCCHGGQSAPCAEWCPRRREEEAREREREKSRRREREEARDYYDPWPRPSARETRAQRDLRKRLAFIREVRDDEKKADAFARAKPRRAIALRMKKEEERVTYKKERKGTKMRITAVRYERLAATEANRFENERVCAEALVAEGEAADDVLAQLKAWVNEKLGIEDVDEEELAEMRRKIARAERRRGL